MGSCVDKQRAAGKVSSPAGNERIQQEANGSTGLEIIQGALATVKFHHTPLTSCDFLLHKFQQTANKPEEVNLTFMILGVDINPPENSVTVTYINENEINIYLILGGEEGVSKTGLTIDIVDASYVEKVNRKTGTPKEGNRVVIVPSRLQEQDITIVMEPVLKIKQSMYLTWKYGFDHQQKKYKKKGQTLQWSSLMFNLLEIYGAENEFKCDSGQQCSVCLSNPANVILTPCRHMCICNECSKSYEKSSNRCPICRSQFRAFIQYS